MKSIAAGVVGIAVAGALGLGVFNLATTGCPLGTCASETAEADANGAAALPVALEGETGEAKDSCCALGGEAEIVMAADKAESCSMAAEGCSEMAEACSEMAAGCSEDKMAACEGEKTACESGIAAGSEVVLAGMAVPAACQEKEGCCSEDGCAEGGECCKSLASDD